MHACVGASPSARPDDCTRPWSACAPLRLHFRVRMIDAPRPPRPTIRAPVAFPSRGSSQSSIVFVASAVIATAAFYCSRQQQPGGSVVTSITSSFVGCHASPAPACGHRPLGSCCRPISNRLSRGGALLLCPRRCRCFTAASCFCARLAALEPIKQNIPGGWCSCKRLWSSDNWSSSYNCARTLHASAYLGLQAWSRTRKAHLEKCEVLARGYSPRDCMWQCKCAGRRAVGIQGRETVCAPCRLRVAITGMLRARVGECDCLRISLIAREFGMCVKGMVVKCCLS